MVKASHPPRCVKRVLRNIKNVVGNFVTCTGGRYGGLFWHIYFSTWIRGWNIKCSLNSVNHNESSQKLPQIFNRVYPTHIYNLEYKKWSRDQLCMKARLAVCWLQKSTKGTIFVSIIHQKIDYISVQLTNVVSMCVAHRYEIEAEVYSTFQLYFSCN